VLKQLRHTPPYSQQFRYTVLKEYDGWKIIDLYLDRFSFRPKEYWEELMAVGDITVNDQNVPSDYTLKEKDIIITKRHDVTEPDVNPHYEILYEQDGILILNKPSPLPVHPAGRYYKNSLIYILREQNPETTFHTIHRLDTWTTGVLVMATNKDKAKLLHKQVEKQEFEKEYGVLAIGDFGNDEFIIDEDVGRRNGIQRGFGPDITEAKNALTKFVPITKNGDITFLKAYPLTGRTNQIRVHINAAGGHILNDPLYSPKENQERSPLSVVRGPSYKKTENELRSTDNEFMGLHCYKMTFKIQKDQEAQTFTAPWPKHFLQFV
jgi:RluA family pseudouridine synthase